MISVFGSSGFVGSRYVSSFPKSSLPIPKGELSPPSNEILYFISTVTNYNVLDGDVYLDIDTNLFLLMQHLEETKKTYGADFTFNFISSWFVYGKSSAPAREDSYCNPTGFYSITKRSAEQLLISYCETFGINYRILRLASVMGRGDKKISKRKNAIQYMIKSMCEGNPVDLYEGKVNRDIIHILDCVRAINLVCKRGEVNSIYNIGSGIPTSVEEMIYYASEIIGNPSLIRRVPIPEFHKVVQSDSMWLDCGKLQNLGYSVKYNSSQIVEDLVDHYSRNKENKNG